MAGMMKSSLGHAAQFKAVLVGLFILGAVVGTSEANLVTRGIFVFGDSLADPGNNNVLTNPLAPKANFVPYGESFFPFPTGRFSNGRLVPDFVANFLVLPFAPSYQQNRNNPLKFIQGANFASAGSGVLDGTNSDEGIITLSTQISEFQSVAAGPSRPIISSSLYVFITGSNDILAYFTNPTLQTTPINAYLQQVAGNLTIQIQRAINTGARKIFVGGLGPIGCTPAAAALNITGTGPAPCFNALNQIALGLNQLLLAIVNGINQAGPARAVFGNSYDYVYNLIQNGASQGFTSGSTACCGNGRFNGQSQCGVVPYTLCPNPQNFVFWDLLHPTQRVDQNVANLLWTGGPSFVYPINLFQLTSLIIP